MQGGILMLVELAIYFSIIFFPIYCWTGIGRHIQYNEQEYPNLFREYLLGCQSCQVLPSGRNILPAGDDTE